MAVFWAHAYGISTQEVTAEILELFIAESRWYSSFYFVHRREQQHKPYFAALFVRREWKRFVSDARTVPFHGSKMLRDLLTCQVKHPSLPPLLVATRSVLYRPESNGHFSSC